MKKLNQHEFAEYIQSRITVNPYCEIAGETWHYDKERNEWVQNEPLVHHCPHCRAEAHVNIRDDNACVDSFLIVDPLSHTVHVDYSSANIDLYQPRYYCVKCGELLKLQSTEDFEKNYRKSHPSNPDEKQPGS